MLCNGLSEKAWSFDKRAAFCLKEGCLAYLLNMLPIPVITILRMVCGFFYAAFLFIYHVVRRLLPFFMRGAGASLADPL